MGKYYEPPEVEETATAETESDTDSSSNTISPTDTIDNSEEQTQTPTTLKDVYIGQINEFDQYVKGEIGFKNAQERQEQVINFIRAFDSLLEGEYGYVKPALHHLIGTINRSPRLYASGDFFAPLYTLKKMPYNVKPERFIDLLCFFIGLAENIKDTRRYIGGRDITYFLRTFNVKQRENVVRFVEDVSHR